MSCIFYLDFINISVNLSNLEYLKMYYLFIYFKILNKKYMKVEPVLIKVTGKTSFMSFI